MKTLILSTQLQQAIHDSFHVPIAATYIHPSDFHTELLQTFELILIVESDYHQLLATYATLPMGTQAIVVVILNEELAITNQFIPIEATIRTNFVIDYLVAPISAGTWGASLQRWQQIDSQHAHTVENPFHVHSFFEKLPELIWFKDTSLHYNHVNAAYANFFAKDVTKIIGETDESLGGELDSTSSSWTDQQILATHESITTTDLIHGANGPGFFEIYKTPVFNNKHELMGIFGFAKEITDLKNAKNEVQFIIDSLPFAACIRNPEGILLQTNTAYQMLFEQPIQIGENIFDEAYTPLASTRTLMHEEDDYILNTKKAISERKTVLVHGSDRVYQFTKAPIFDMNNKLTNILVLMHDVSEAVLQEQKIRNLAFSDALTGLGNRTSLYDILEQPHQLDFGQIFIIDLKNFKAFNTRYGHQASNAVLVQIGQRLQRLFPYDFVCRSGGDEFMLFRTTSDLCSDEALFTRAQHVLKCAEEHAYVDGLYYHMSVNIGCIAFPLAKLAIEEMLANVEFALQTAKNQPEQIACFNQKLAEPQKIRLQLLEDFEVALSHNQCELFYQPQYTCSRELIGFEALFRWPNNPYPNLNIAQIIAIIETSPLIHQFGDWVLAQTASFAKIINAQTTHPFTIGVNLSAYQIMRPDFVAQLTQLLATHQIPASYLDLEITESVLLEDLATNLLKFAKLKALGFKVSLDDFGTGYSSLNYLAKLPLSIVKIDRSFIIELTSSEQYQTLVQLIINAAHSLKLQVVAEGVESIDELTLLQSWGCDYIQGYYFSRPLPREDALKLVK